MFVAIAHIKLQGSLGESLPDLLKKSFCDTAISLVTVCEVLSI